ncbi:MAG: hypothetical protein A2521_10035 [Deltaproteobacteria bacterium RIFOXYD12_FULL_57_12]|nr:MAG: hypothetical protein A2521_10035 [Deltaproteobacteria bacterium RIFOXYD12_FULL_57_12]
MLPAGRKNRAVTGDGQRKQRPRLGTRFSLAGPLKIVGEKELCFMTCFLIKCIEDEQAAVLFFD